MRRTNLETMPCPIARSLERVGAWWSILILRDAFYGLKRFDDFQASLGVAPGILTRRLKALVESGLLERRPYQDRPVRYDYILTERGRDFRPVLLNLLAWGNRHFAPDGISVDLQDRQTGEAVVPAFAAAGSERPVPLTDIKIVAGPAATAGTRRRLSRQIASTEEIAL